MKTDFIWDDILCISLRCHSYQTALQVQGKNQNSEMVNAGEEIEKMEFWFTVGRMYVITTIIISSVQVLQNTKNITSKWAIHTYSEYSALKMKAHQRGICIHVWCFINMVETISKLQNQSRYPQMEKNIRKTAVTHNGVLFNDKRRMMSSHLQENE